MAKNYSIDQPRGEDGQYRRKLELTPQLLKVVYKLGIIGCTVEEVASAIGVSERTAETWLLDDEHKFSVAYRGGKKDGRKTLRRKQWQAAMSGNIVMQIWLGKQLLGQRDLPQTMVQVNTETNVELRNPAQVKEELIELQRNVWIEAAKVGGVEQLEDKG